MSLLLSSVWTGQNPSGWWMSEKFDGVRALWDGEVLWSRNGNHFAPPGWWTASLPAIALDGELWLGRKRYLETMGTLKRSTPNDAIWGQMQFRVFDAPSHPGTFEERQSYLTSLSLPFPGSLVTHEPCRGLRHLKRFLCEIHRLGGEGLMLRKAGSLYVRERSPSLLKVRWQNNTELLR